MPPKTDRTRLAAKALYRVLSAFRNVIQMELRETDEKARVDLHATQEKDTANREPALRRYAQLCNLIQRKDQCQEVNDAVRDGVDEHANTAVDALGRRQGSELDIPKRFQRTTLCQSKYSHADTPRNI